MADKVLDVKDLRVTFETYQGSVQAVRGVSFHVNRKETVGIVGESGCGKSVTIRTVMGLNQKSASAVKSGEALFEGRDVLKMNDKEIMDLLGNRMSMIFQDPFTFLNPTMQVGRQITETYLRHHRVSRQEAHEKALSILRLISFPNPEQNMKRYPHQLSGGMRQRIMIAMALICEPAVLFADEPTTALDVTIQAQIIDLMNSLKEKTDTSIVLITHDMGVVAKMVDRLYVMYAGKIVERGSADALFHRPRHPYTWGLLDSVLRLDEKTKEELHSIPGMPPDLIAPPPGCPFAARCRYAMKICQRQMPEPFVLDEDDHAAACWLCHPEYVERFGETGREGTRNEK